MEGLSQGLFNKTSVCETNVLKVNYTMSFKTKSTLDVFKNYCSTLADNLFKKNPTPTSKYTFNNVVQYYTHFIQIERFSFDKCYRSLNRKNFKKHKRL